MAAVAAPAVAPAPCAGLPRDRVLWIAAALALALRLGLLALVGNDLALRGDESTYQREALAFLRSGEFDTGDFVRPPLYFLFFAAAALLGAPFGFEAAGVLRVLQCLISVATALPVYRSGLRIGGLPLARGAALLLLFDPTLIAYTHMLWPETLFLALVAWICDGLAALTPQRRLATALHGLLFGAGMLLKPVLGLLALLLVPWWWRRQGLRAAAALALLFGGAAACAIAPWVLRNQLRYGPAIVLENQGPYNLWIGNDPAPAREILETWIALGDPLERMRVGRERGLAAIAADPARFLRLCAERALNVWGLEFFVVRNLALGAYGPVSDGCFRAIVIGIEAAWGLLFVLAGLGAARAMRDPTLRLLLLHAALFTALVATMVGTTRFRIPFAYLIALSAGMGWQALYARPVGRRELAGALLALSLLALSAQRPLFRTLFGESPTSASRQIRDSDWRFFRY